MSDLPAAPDLMNAGPPVPSPAPTGFSLAELAPYRTRVEAELDRWLEGPESGPGDLTAAMRHSVLAGGKRLRPILCLLAGEAVGADLDRVAPVAASLELIHAFSLVHDDLPCMDDSDFRRGEPTCHRRFGEATAVLAGDALLALAFRVAVEGGLERGVSPRVLTDVVRTLARAVGSGGLIGGQVLDLAAEGRAVPLAGLEQIHRMKTGALLTAAVTTGARLGNPEDAELRVFERFGRLFGQVFQITDDILDVVGEFAELGKVPASDQARGKATYPQLMGVDGARRTVMALVTEAVSLLASLPDRDTRRLRDLTIYLPGRTR